jgi:Helix-turn-helix of DDE superfamily endonuclease
MRFQQIHLLPPERVHALVGFSPQGLAELLAIVLPAVDRYRTAAIRAARPHRRRAPGAGRKRLLHPAQEVLLVLIYLHHNVAHRVVGQLFGVSADISEALFHEIMPILQEVCPTNRFEAEKRWKRNMPPWQPEKLDRMLLDTFATSVLQPTGAARQKRGYSGKKKRPTLKTHLATDATGEVRAIEVGHQGPAAARRSYEGGASATQFPTATKQGDLAYMDTTNVLMPHHKPRGRVVGDELWQENHRHALRLFLPDDRRGRHWLSPFGAHPPNGLKTAPPHAHDRGGCRSIDEFLISRII